MAHYKTTVVIPVLNNWDLTRTCLKTLAATLPENVEIIVVDNGSRDATAQFCGVVGSQLFGQRFRHMRLEENINYGPACNLGARLAKGEYLLLLNNDTEALPGWYEPLLDDFATIDGLGATGPLLMYPPVAPLGHLVQHLGVSISPSRRVMHLYEGIPAMSPLAGRRRFFQAITAACMLLPRELFMQLGMFDVAYVNGFEDVDLCVRMKNRGLKLTVNARARMIHHQGSTLGRYAGEATNSRLHQERSKASITPDWHEFLLADHLRPAVNDWLQLTPAMDRALEEELASRAVAAEDIVATLLAHPFWEPGWQRLTQVFQKLEPRLIFDKAWDRVFHGIKPLMDICECALAVRDVHESSASFHAMTTYCRSVQAYQEECARKKREALENGLSVMGEAFDAWEKNVANFAAGPHAEFMKKFWAIGLDKNVLFRPFSDWAYPAWMYNADRPRRDKWLEEGRGAGEDILISILMPVYNPQPAHLRGALDSVLAQSHGAWELCVADDASTATSTRAILTEYAGKDDRVKVCWREQNGHIAAATNTALAMATGPFVAFMDQDDLLTPDALAIMASAIARHPEAQLFYSDEDRLHDLGEYCYPYFKNNAWDWELLTEQNFVSHLSIYRTERVRCLGGLREGFAGSQDYDLVLRYVSGLTEDKFIHVPHVLYHWRAHDGSTAKSIAAKPEAQVSSAAAVDQWAATHAPGATVTQIPRLTFQRLKYPIPDPLPSITIVCDAWLQRPQWEEMADRWETAGLPCHLVLLVSEAQKEAALAHVGSRGRWRILVNDFPAGERWNWAMQQLPTDIVGIFNASVVPMAESCWLEEMVGTLWRPGVGAVGGRLRTVKGELQDGGWLAGADGGLSPILESAPWEQSAWVGWNRLGRTVLAVNGAGFFLKADLWRQLGGVNPAYAAAPLEDLCMRITGAGQKVIWWPFADFEMTRGTPPRERAAAQREINESWRGVFMPCSPNLLIRNGDWQLCPTF